jgi:WD40 repeat protein
VRGALTPGECARAIAEAERQGFEKTAGLYPPRYRDNDRLVRDDERLARVLFKRLRSILPERVIVDGTGWSLVGLNSRFRWCRYREGQGFCVHRDGAHSPAPDVRSLLTCQLYLNDAGAFHGGRTRFYESSAADARLSGFVAAETGAAIVFDHNLWHDGERVTSGTKYVMRTDVMYRRDVAEMASEEGELRGHTGYVFSLLARRDGTIASGSRDRSIRIWRDGAEIACLRGHDASVSALIEDSDGTLWSASRDGTVRRWSEGRGHIVTQQQSAVLALAALGDGRVISTLADGSVSVLGPNGHTESCYAHEGWVWGLAVAHGVLATAGEDGALAFWDMGEPRITSRLKIGVPLRALCATSGGFALGGEDGIVRLVHPMPDGPRVVREARSHDAAVAALASFGERLATGGEDDCARLLGPGLETVSTLRHPGFVRALAVRGTSLITGCYDGVIRVRTVSGSTAVSPRPAGAEVV